MSGHTPGPWEVAGDDKNGQAVVRSEHVEVATCWHHSVGSIEREMRANARLIAAAPELLEALRKAVHTPRGDYSWLDEARAAIAKATGALPSSE